MKKEKEIVPVELSIVKIPISKIVPDDNQPRKYFDARAMRTLIEDIKRNGILSPLRLEAMANDKYLIENGERRYRASKELGLKEVPAIVVPFSTRSERLIRQYVQQSMSQDWSPTERAEAVLTLAKEEGVTIKQAAAMVGVDHKSTVDLFTAYNNIADKGVFERKEIPFEWSKNISSLKNSVKNIKINIENEDFNFSDEKVFERRVADSIISGSIRNQFDITKIKDSLTKNPKLLKEFMEDKSMTPNQLFVKSKGRGAFHLRNVFVSGNRLESHISAFLEVKDVALSKEQVDTLKRFRNSIDSMISLVE